MWLRWLLQNHSRFNPVTKKGINHVKFYYPRNTDDCTSSRFFTSPSRSCFRSHERKKLLSGKYVYLGGKLSHLTSSCYLLLRPTGNHSTMDCGFEYRLLWCLLERSTARKSTYIAPHYSYNECYCHYGIIHFALTQKRIIWSFFYFFKRFLLPCSTDTTQLDYWWDKLGISLGFAGFLPTRDRLKRH